MSNNARVKLYKNEKRNTEENYKPYVPQYQVMGVDPGEYKSAVLPDNTRVAKPAEENPRVRKFGVRQPYAESVPSPIGRGKGPIPNVGNNIEHTWSSVDGEIVDDLNESQSLDSNHPMVDNNDFVSAAAMGLPTEAEELPTLDEVQSPPRIRFTKAQVERAFNQGAERAMSKHQTRGPTSEEDLFPIVRDLEEGTYLLIVAGVPVCSGPKEEIEEQARALVFGEHEICDGNPVPDDDIIILKRVSVKIGLFLE